MPRSSTQYKLAGTKFYRASSTKVMGMFGGNLQNIDKITRAIYTSDGWSYDNENLLIRMVKWLESADINDVSCFTQEELTKLRALVQVDQAGAEALVVAWICRAGKYRELFQHGVKPHVFIALHNFHKQLSFERPDLAVTINRALHTSIPDLKALEGWKMVDKLIKDTDNWPAQKRYYFIAKMICHASNYDMKASTFQINVLEKSEGKVVLSKQEAESSLSNYHLLFPEIRYWHEMCREKALKDGLLYNCLGYPIQFTTELSESNMKDVYAAAPQSTVGCLTHIAYTREQALIEQSGLRWDLLNNCHDSDLSQVPLVDIAKCVKAKLAFFSEPELFSPYRPSDKFHMRAEAQIGFNWGPAHELPEGEPLTMANIYKYNLLGLREIKMAT